MDHYDVIVLGIGGIGSAVLDHLAQRGVRALGIDRFQPPHEHGSTHGHTRIIRQAYFEHPDYVPLLTESYRLWHDLELRADKKLYHEAGLIQIGPPEGVVVPGVLRAATQHGLSVESLSAGEIGARWPGIHAPDNLVGVFESRAGYLLVEDCVAAHLALAKAAGAHTLVDTTVLSWTASPNAVLVQTERGEFAADRLVITAGPWAVQLLDSLNVSLSVRRKALFWFATDSTQYGVGAGFPAFLLEMPPGSELGEGSVFYGFPRMDGRGIKIAEHSGGRTVEDPLTVDRAVDLKEQQRLRKVIATYLPGVSAEMTDHAVCLYTMSPDENFVVDVHPEHQNVAFAAGLSGHGFKFASVLGKALADLTVDGRTELPMSFLSLERLRTR